jgi:hypothetical protein
MKAQYDEWGVVVETSQVRGAHIANGFVQLLRLFPDQPRWTAGQVDPAEYVKAVTNALAARFGAAGGADGLGTWKLSDPARALCVTTTQEGPLSLAATPSDDEPEFFKAGRDHVARFLEMGVAPSETPKVHAAFASALNADGRVFASGGDDPTPPSLALAGYTSIHTLRGMHAATFLGLLCKTPAGARVVRALYDHFRSDADPHSQLVRWLQLDLRVAANGDAPFDGAYPVPDGAGWSELAIKAARVATRLLEWSKSGGGKADALMAFVDLASLVLFLRLVQWRRPGDGPPPLLLVVSPARIRPSEAISRAKQSLLALCAKADFLAEASKLVIKDYSPGVHAQNLGAAGGWLFPLDARGAPKRWFCPGPRQLQTLVHALISPGEELAWPAFATRALEEFGLVLGGVAESKLAADLGLGGGANSVREAGKINREHLVALGLARQESDNVILVDGGGK